MTQNRLLKSLLQLKDYSKGAIADGISGSFDDVKKYLHIERKIEGKLLEILQCAAQIDTKQLVLVCGNAGDGKSHLLSRLRNTQIDLIDEFRVHNDATESFSPDRSYLDELTHLLAPFSDERLTIGREKIILAINLGTLSNFLAATQDSFKRLNDYVERKKILVEGVAVSQSFDDDSPFQFVNFCDNHLFKLTPDGPVSEIVIEMFERVTAESDSNPIYKAYVEDAQIQSEACPIHFNYSLLGMKVIQQQLSQLLIQCILKQGLIISIRALYNFIYDIIVPVNRDLESTGQLDLDAILPNYIFEHPEVSPIFKALHELDPVRRSSETMDDLIIKIAVYETPRYLFESHFDIKAYGPSFTSVLDADDDRTILIKTFIRMSMLNRKKMLVTDEPYHDFTRFLYHNYHGDKIQMKQLWRKLKSAIYTWNGNAEDGRINIYTEHVQREYRMSEELDFLPDFNSLPTAPGEDVEVFNTKIPITVMPTGGAPDKILIDYRFYALLDAMSFGYRPCALDKSEFFSFSKFVERLSEAGSKKERVYFQEVGNGDRFLLERDDFGDFCFRRVEE